MAKGASWSGTSLERRVLILGMVQILAVGAALEPRSKAAGGVGGTFTMAMKTLMRGNIYYIAIDITIKSYSIRGGGHCYNSPQLSSGPVTQVHILDSETTQGGPPPNIVLIYDKALLL